MKNALKSLKTSFSLFCDKLYGDEAKNSLKRHIKRFIFEGLLKESHIF